MATTVMHNGVQRLRPVGPVQAYRTYQIVAPMKTHMKQVSCEEFGCINFRNGFKVAVPLGPEGDRLRRLVKTSGKPYTKEEGEGVQYAIFAPGTSCFAEATHMKQVLPELYVVRDGDWRGNPTGKRRQHTKPEFWVEDFALHQDKLITEQKKG